MSLPRRGSGRRAGFTLVELLVVTSVLAVLSGMLLPVFARARERGREAACRSHIRQLGMGLLLYTQDYDGQFPSFWVDPLAAAHARQADYWHDRFCAGLDLLPGQAKIKRGGGHAGHNGLRDIQARLGSADFWRLRLGIGHPRSLQLEQEVVDFVLHRPSREQRQQIEDSIGRALDCLPLLVAGDPESAMHRLHTRG